MAISKGVNFRDIFEDPPFLGKFDDFPTSQYSESPTPPMNGVCEEAGKPENCVQKVIKWNEPKVWGDFAVAENGLVEVNETEESTAADKEEERHSRERESFQNEEDRC